MAAMMVSSGSVVAAPLSATKMSSSAAFGGSAAPAQFAPARMSVNRSTGRVVAVNASYESEENKSMTRQVMNSILAAGVAISLTTGSAFAASGPGNDGAERTARKADELLQGADALIKNDSPQRFGPDRGLEAASEDVDRFSQKAGSGAIPAIQDASSAQVAGAREKIAKNVKKTQKTFDRWFGSKSLPTDIVGDAQGKADDVAKSAKNAVGQSTKGKVGNVASVKSKVDEVAAPAKGGFFGKIKQQTKGLQGAVASKGNEAKTAVSKLGK